MLNEIQTRNRRFIENTAIFLMITLALLLISVSFFSPPGLNAYAQHYLVVDRTMQRFFGVLLLFCARSLYMRSRAAWSISLTALTGNFVLHILRFHSGHTHFLGIPVVFELFIIIVLLYNWRDFSRRPNRYRVRKGIFFGTGIIVLVLLNSALCYNSLADVYGHPLTLPESVFASLKVMFGTEVLEYHAHIFVIMERIFTCFNWFCVVVGLLLILSPFIYKPKPNAKAKAHVLELLRRYGQNTGCWLYLEDDKSYYFGENVDGVAAYAISGRTMVILGDPVCAPENFVIFLTELKTYCNINNYNMVFLSISNRFLNFYKQLDFGYVKCGEEPFFKLAEYNLTGKDAAKIRAAVNHGRKAGITVMEYCPLKERDSRIEAQIQAITREWLTLKKSHEELIFTLGKVGLDDPNDKRYFYAVDESGEMQGFIVFLPFMQGKAFYADVTRRRAAAPRGTMENIMYDAMQIMKEDHIELVSMGLAPLAHLDKEDDRGNRALAALFTYVHDHFNSFYDFENLSRAKQKYNPTSWEPAYFAYSPKMLTPSMALAVIAVQSPTGFSQYLISFLQNLRSEAQKIKEKKTER